MRGQRRHHHGHAVFGVTRPFAVRVVLPGDIRSAQRPVPESSAILPAVSTTPSPRALRLRLLLALLVGWLLLAPPTSPVAFAEPVAPVATGAIDTSDRAAVAAAYTDVFVPNAAVAAPAADPEATAACDAGAPDEALQTATENLVNYVRAMSGVGAVSFDGSLSAKAQQAALMMHANGALNHQPPQDWACYTPAGAEAAGKSNLCLCAPNAAVVKAYLDDAGTDNSETGHRWWLQRPTTQTMGSGAYGSAHALWVQGQEAAVDSPTVTAWPSAGYFPAALEPAGRWSFTAWQPYYDLSRATVVVRDSAGRAVGVSAHPVGTYGALVFEVGSLPAPVGTVADRYTVTVSDIVVDGSSIAPYSYEVALFDPTAAEVPPAPLAALDRPTIAGTPRLGETMTADGPQWSLDGVTTAYAWLRDGKSVSTGRTRTLSAADLGKTMSVRATGALNGQTVTAVSGPTSKVARKLARVTVTGRSTKVGKVSLSIAVTAPGEKAVSGTVSVKRGTRTLVSRLTLRSGKATFAATKVPAGTHVYTVRYAGNSRVAPQSTTASVTTKPKATPVIGLSASTTPGAVRVKITVTAPGEGPLGGYVSVKEGSTTRKAKLKITKGRATYSATKVKAGKHTYTMRYLGSSEVKAGSAKVSVTVKAPVVVKRYANCKELNRDHPHGVGRPGAVDHVSGSTEPVTDFLRHAGLYNANTGRDGDKDGIACEKL